MYFEILSQSRLHCSLAILRCRGLVSVLIADKVYCLFWCGLSKQVDSTKACTLQAAGYIYIDFRLFRDRSQVQKPRTRQVVFGPVYTIPNYFSYRINFHSDGKICACLHYTVSLGSEVILSLQNWY